MWYINSAGDYCKLDAVVLNIQFNGNREPPLYGEIRMDNKHSLNSEGIGTWF